MIKHLLLRTIQSQLCGALTFSSIPHSAYFSGE